jgi:hypothetical protein
MGQVGSFDNPLGVTDFDPQAKSKPLFAVSWTTCSGVWAARQQRISWVHFRSAPPPRTQASMSEQLEFPEEADPRAGSDFLSIQG